MTDNLSYIMLELEAERDPPAIVTRSIRAALHRIVKAVFGSEADRRSDSQAEAFQDSSKNKAVVALQFRIPGAQVNSPAIRSWGPGEERVPPGRMRWSPACSMISFA
jgi:hypothetical protein